jgi:predicted 3-demethylubiquinone-9 3-methyltransferase (glyoxalase superfamily)
MVLLEMLTAPEQAKAERAMGAMLKMKKLDIAALKQAYEG